MPAQAIVSSLTLGPSALLTNPIGIAFALFVAGAVDAYLIGAIFAPITNSDDLGSQNVNVRSAAGSHKIVYGRTMVGGTVVFLDVLDRYYLSRKTGRVCPPVIKERRDSGAFLNMAVAIAAHEIDAVEELWIGEDKVFQANTITGRMELTRTKYRDHIDFIYENGTQTTYDTFIKANVDKHYTGRNLNAAGNIAYYAPQGVTGMTGSTVTFDSSIKYDTTNLISWDFNIHTGGQDGNNTPCVGNADGVFTLDDTGSTGRTEPDAGRPWKSNYRLTNTAYVYLRFRFNPDLYNGIPKVRAVIRGKKVYDPRWSEANVTMSDEGTWAASTAYAVNDKVVRSGNYFVCQEAHTSSAEAAAEDQFQEDFLINRYWKNVHVYDDPATWEWSDNWALCVRDYLTSGNYHSVKLGSYSKKDELNLYGIGVKETEIDDDNIIAAANCSDEEVFLRDSALTVDSASYNANTDTQTVNIIDDFTDYYVRHEAIQITAGTIRTVRTAGSRTDTGIGGQAPGEISVLRETVSESLYFIEEAYYTTGTDTTTVLFKTNEDLSPTAIRLWSRRFTVNGVVDTANSPIQTLENILVAGAGKLPYSQGKFLVVPGVYITPTITIDETNLAGPLTVQGSLPSADLINTVVGTIKNPSAFWEETNFAKQFHQDYINEDGGYELVQSTKYMYTTSNFDAQRLARISLQRVREGVSATLVCNLSVMEIPIGEFININLDRLGWSNKVFSVTSWAFDNNKIILGVREENSVAYDWTNVLLTPIPYSASTDFQVAPELAPVTSLLMESGTDQLISLADGTIVPRVKVSWVSPEQDFQTYLFITYGIRPFEIDNDILLYREVRIQDTDQQEHFIDELREGDMLTLTIVVRYDDPNIDIESAGTSVLEHTVIGKSAPPADITSFANTINEDMIVLTWDPNTEIDFGHYEIQVGGSAWDSPVIVGTNDTLDATGITLEDTTATFLTDAVVGQIVTNVTDGSTGIITSVPNDTHVIMTAGLSGGTNDEWQVTDTYNLGASVLVDTTTSTEYIITGHVIGAFTYRIKAIDTSGNESVTEATTGVTITGPVAVSSINNTILAQNINIFWGEVTAGSFTVAGYHIRYGGSDFDTGATELTILSGTDYIIPNTWVGARIFRIKAFDIYGNFSTETNASITITVPNVAMIISPGATVVGDRVEFGWTPNPGTFAIQSYDIRYDDGTGTYAQAGTFDAGPPEKGPIIITSTEGFSRRIDWAGNRRFWIGSIDTVGNYGTGNELTESLSVTVPGSFTIVPQVIDNNVLLSWSEPSVHTLPISYYEIKKGTTYIGSTLIGNISGLFSAIFETIAGNYTYWITAIDSAGNPGTNNSRTVAVNEPPDYSLLVNYTDDFTGDLVNAFVNSAGLINAPVDTVQTWTTHFDDGVTAGTHTAATHATILTDSTAKFLTTATTGMVVNNITDGSTTTVTTITNDNNMTLAVLTGGTLDTWTTNDEYNLVSWDSPEAQVDAGFPIYIQSTPATGSYEFIYDYAAIVSNLSVTCNVTSEIIAGDPVMTLEVETSTASTDTGTNDTTDATGITLHDNTGTFTTDAVAGDIVTNDDDGSWAVITDVTDATHMDMSGGLQDGSINEWTSGDNYTLHDWTTYPTTTETSLQVFAAQFRHVRVSLDVASSVNDTDLIEISNIGLVIDVKEITDAGTNVVSVITGTNDTADATGVTLHDTTATFETDAFVGQTVRNTTDSANVDTGQITSITDDTHVVMTALTGPSDGEWGSGDTYKLGTKVTFTKPFIDITALTVTPGLLGLNATAVYDFEDAANPTTFYVHMFDEDGLDLDSGTFSWVARGF